MSRYMLQGNSYPQWPSTPSPVRKAIQIISVAICKFGPNIVGPKAPGEHYADEIIYWVEVLCANAHCVNKIMVNLVEKSIEKLVVHQFVEEIKSNILCYH